MALSLADVLVNRIAAQQLEGRRRLADSETAAPVARHYEPASVPCTRPGRARARRNFFENFLQAVVEELRSDADMLKATTQQRARPSETNHVAREKEVPGLQGH